MVKSRFVCVCFLLLVTIKVSSQSITRAVISIAGNTGNVTEGLITFSVGEAITGSLITPANGISQGFQQPSLINNQDFKIVSGINAVEVYPNPVVINLTILFNIRTIKLLRIEVYSSRGTIYRTESYSVSESGFIELKMETFPSGLYLIHVYSTDRLIDRVFKIEKI